MKMAFGSLRSFSMVRLPARLGACCRPPSSFSEGVSFPFFFAAPAAAGVAVAAGFFLAVPPRWAGGGRADEDPDELSSLSDDAPDSDMACGVWEGVWFG